MGFGISAVGVPHFPGYAPEKDGRNANAFALQPEGQVAVITGSSRGIGKAAAEVMAELGAMEILAEAGRRFLWHSGWMPTNFVREATGTGHMQCRPAHAYARAAIAAAAFACPPGAAVAQVGQWQLTTNTEYRYFSWEGTRGFPTALLGTARGSGSQYYVPMAARLVGVPVENLKFELIGRGGYVRSQQTTPGASGAVSTFTDTVVAGTWTYYGITGIQPFISVSGNIPTGQSALSGFDTFARMDPDLVDLATFGEGWNYGATIGFNLPLTKDLVASFGVGHTVRRSYFRETTAGVPPSGETLVDPGDVTTFNASLGYRHGALTGRLSASYSREGDTAYGGVPGFKAGDRYFVSSFSNYAWSKTSVTNLVMSWNYYEKNKAIIPPLMTEAFNSNSNVYRVQLGHTFVVGKLSFGPIVSYLFRDRNAYSTAAFQFVPAKTRWSAGGSAQFGFGDNASIYARVERIWIDQGAGPSGVVTPVPALKFTGWSAVVGGSVRY